MTGPVSGYMRRQLRRWELMLRVRLKKILAQVKPTPLPYEQINSPELCGVIWITYEVCYEKENCNRIRGVGGWQYQCSVRLEKPERRCARCFRHAGSPQHQCWIEGWRSREQRIGPRGRPRGPESVARDLR